MKDVSTGCSITLAREDADAKVKRTRELLEQQKRDQENAVAMPAELRARWIKSP